MDTLWFVNVPLILAIYIFTKHFFHKLKNLPPSSLLNLPIIGHLHLIIGKPLYRSLAKISARYGPVVLLHFGSRRVLVVSSPSAAEECFTKNDVVFANRPRLIAGKYIGYDYTSLTWSSYGDHWRSLRKISSTEFFSAHRLQMFQAIRADEVKSTVRALNRAAEGRRPVDMKAAFFEMVMNAVMRMIAGKRFYGEDVEDVELAARFREITVDTFRLATANMGDFLPVLRWLGVGGVEKELVELQRKRDAFMQDLVEGCKKRFRSYVGGGGEVEGKTKTMIEMLLTLQDKEPEYYTDGLIRSLMLALLVAGTDTTVGTLEWALSLLLNNPHALKKAQIEIDNHIKSHDRLIDESDISDLPYLRCIINETLRIYPPGPLLVPHESSAECTVGGYTVPARTMLLVNAWAIHNDPKNWADPTEFKPERFESGLEGYRVGYKMMPFGSGRRSCPGEGLAVRVVGSALGSLIQCFDWERVGEELIDMKEGVGLTMPKAIPLMAYCKIRPEVANLVSNI